MNVVSSYAVRIMSTELTGIIKNTIVIYRSAVSYLIDFYYPKWERIQSSGNSQERFNYAEKLVHTTKKTSAVCDFDTRTLNTLRTLNQTLRILNCETSAA